MPRLSKIGAAALAAFGFTGGAAAVTANYLIVAGGAGGGADRGGGGGAGGLLANTVSLSLTTSYAISVGAGGAGQISVSGPQGTNGSASSIAGLLSTAGGGGGGCGPNSSLSSYILGSSGGSGGGGGASASGGTTTGGSGTAGQGNNGGSGASAVGGNLAGGGGGGAGAVGGNASGNTAGNGGNGVASSISGSSVTYAGGGGGGWDTRSGGGAGSGGSGGGAAGGYNNANSNTGGGGGGGNVNLGTTTGYGGNGGSGIVIISYTGAQQFGGGTVTSSGGNTIHTFTSSGVLSPISSLSASYLIVAGGGGGGSGQVAAYAAAGGGAGGLLTSTVTIDTNSTYAVVVGAGGAAGASSPSNGVQGSNSTFSIVSTAAVGGGYGGGVGTGGAGGSGGGSDSATAALGTAGQGNNGGISGSNAAGGGGGAGAVGGNGSAVTPSVGGLGGAGSASSISGSSVTYAGGGGAGGVVAGGAGGSGGGGAGGSTGTAGTANTGGGGGGAYPNLGGAGGSGIVIISYAGSTQQMAGGSVTITGGNVIHTFTSSGYLTPLTYYSNSLRFRASASGNLTRTPTVASSTTTWTWSAWVKRGTLTTATRNPIFAVGGFSGTPTEHAIYFNASGSVADSLEFEYYNPTYNYYIVTSAVYRDPAAWYHIVGVWDTTNATAANRIRLYVNGTQVTALSASGYPTQNFAGVVNTAVTHYLGAAVNNYTNFDGYMTNINFIDGQALTPNSFGTFNSYGVWQPINYGGSYGTNGFYLPFTNATSTTTLGYDFSPQGNNWTTNNISLTAGSTYDSMTDVPTLTSATAANYAVLNPLNIGSGSSLSNGNLNFSVSSAISQIQQAQTTGTMGIASGKFYWEVVWSSMTNPTTGVCNSTQSPALSPYSASNIRVYAATSPGYKSSGATSVTYGTTWTVGDVIGVALDMDSGTITFYKNNTSQGTAYTDLAGQTWFPFVTNFASAETDVGYINFGQRPFVYTPPSGFVALNTYNL